MAKPKATGFRRLYLALGYSLQGARAVWRREEGVRIEAAAVILAVPTAVWLSESAFQAAILIGSVLLVLLIEVINSAIEAVVDRIGPERHVLSKIAKDLGSLAVLIAAVMAAGLWGAAAYDAFGAG